MTELWFACYLRVTGSIRAQENLSIFVDNPASFVAGANYKAVLENERKTVFVQIFLVKFSLSKFLCRLNS